MPVERHTEETKAQIAASVKRAYAEGRHQICRGGTHGLVAFRASYRAGKVLWPNQKPERDAAIVAEHASSHSLKYTGEKFGITAAAVWCVVKRCNPSQLRKGRNYAALPNS